MLTWFTDSVFLNALQNVKRWHVAHAATHPVELQFWDAVLTVWFMSWPGWAPVWLLDAFWAAPLCLLGNLAPSLYLAGRKRAHLAGRLRCDWLGSVHSLR